MALTDTQKNELARFMGYPDLGQPVGNNVALMSLASAFRFLDPVGYFQTRISTLSQDAEVQIYGQESAYWGTYGTAKPPGIQWTDPKTGTTYNGYIPTLRVLEGDIPNIRQFRSFTKADVVNFNATEPQDRVALYNYFRQKLATLLAMPLDPQVIPRKRRGVFRFR